jgi:transposase, IS6 family
VWEQRGCARTRAAPRRATGGTVALAQGVLVQAGLMSHRPASVPARRSSLAGFRFPREVIVLAVRWYLRFGLSYRDVEELLAERGIAVDHVTIYRWVQRCTPELIDAARPGRHVAGDRWFVDGTYLKLAGRWVYLYRAIDQHGQVIDVLASPKRDLAATRRFFARALNGARRPTEVTTDRAPAYPRVLDELVPRGVARGGAVRQQSDRIRSRPVEGSDPSDARFEAAPLRPGGLWRACVRSEPAPRSLRTRTRY